MSKRNRKYAMIAECLRQQCFHDVVPLKHEWVELLVQLARTEDCKLREMAITELVQCAEYSSQRMRTTSVPIAANTPDCIGRE